MSLTEQIYRRLTSETSEKARETIQELRRIMERVDNLEQWVTHPTSELELPPILNSGHPIQLKDCIVDGPEEWKDEIKFKHLTLKGFMVYLDVWKISKDRYSSIGESQIRQFIYVLDTKLHLNLSVPQLDMERWVRCISFATLASYRTERPRAFKYLLAYHLHNLSMDYASQQESVLSIFREALREIKIKRVEINQYNMIRTGILQSLDITYDQDITVIFHSGSIRRDDPVRWKVFEATTVAHIESSKYDFINQPTDEDLYSLFGLRLNPCLLPVKIRGLKTLSWKTRDLREVVDIVVSSEKTLEKVKVKHQGDFEEGLHDLLALVRGMGIEYSIEVSDVKYEST